MKINKNCIVVLKYSVADAEGNLLDPGAEPIVYLHGGYDDMFEPIEKALDGKAEGFVCSVAMEPSEAFGEYNGELVVVEPRSSFGDDLSVGMQVEGEMDDEFRIFTVSDIKDDKVVLDGNHPLSGIAIVFSCEILSVRAATAEEISEKLGSKHA
jgi:FKBP-type peptidyl-prolyl cis-trans isomerase SlyD